MQTPLNPFEATEEQLAEHIEEYIRAFSNALQSFFMVMPRGKSVLEFDRFREAYETLLRITHRFENFSQSAVVSAVRQDSLVLVVLRAILGLTPSELASVASLTTGISVSQGFGRAVDQRAREGVDLFHNVRGDTQTRVLALVQTAVQLILGGVPQTPAGVIHRLDKADTRQGIESVRRLAEIGVAYDALLYERLLGRPFATHRDSVSESVGSIVEDAVEDELKRAGITYYRTGRAERFEDMDQAPDFFVPTASAPEVIIEAKLAEDDGTARDKVTRIQHLAELRESRLRRGEPSFEVIACVDGRGFGIRREDVRKLLLATRGKLFTLRTVSRIIQGTSLRVFVR